MPGFLAHVGAITNCIHITGAVIPTITSPPRVFVNGAQQVLTIKDPLTVAGCLFIVALKPQPCVLVRLEPSTRVFVNGAPALILTPLAMCFSAEQAPQGPPLAIPIQKRVVAM
jgi:hypothetical protein